MPSSTTLKIRYAVAAAGLALLVAACSGGADGDDASEPVPQQPDTQTVPQDVEDVLNDALEGPDADGDDGRVFGASDDIVIESIETTFASENATAQWDGSTLRVTMDGSVDDPTATLPCSAINALLADGETSIISYDDGEVDCSDPHGGND